VDAVPRMQKQVWNMAERCRICLLDYGCMTSINEEHIESKLKDLTKCTCIDVNILIYFSVYFVIVLYC